MLAQTRARALNFGEELLPETRHTVFIEHCRRPQFGVRGTVEFDPHRCFS